MAALLFISASSSPPPLPPRNYNQQIPFLLSLLFLSALPSSSLSTNISYADHCNTIVQSAPSDSNDFSDTSFRISNGYFIGADRVLGHSSDFDSSIHRSFTFHSRSVLFTRTQGTLQVAGTLILRGGGVDFAFGNSRGRSLRLVSSWNPRDFNQRGGRIRADLWGFWSEESGKLCMVGTGSGRSKDGMNLDFSLVFKIKYPSSADIRSSVVSGYLESLESVESSSYFDRITVLAYAQMKYEYSKVLQARSSCSSLNDSVDRSLGFLNRNRSICDASDDFFWTRLKLEYGNNCTEKNCGPLSNDLGFQPTFLKFTMVDCADNGNLRLVVLFSNSNYTGLSPSTMMFEPGMAMVAEGSWARKNNQLCLIACLVNKVADALADYAVDNCTIGISLAFPAVLTIESRNTVVGSIWSNLNETSPGYFSSIPFHSFGFNREYDSDLRYKYTKMDTVRKSCTEADFGKHGKKRYPDPINVGDFTFFLRTKTPEGKLGSGFAKPLALGEAIYHYFPMNNFTLVTNNESIWNISYSLRLAYHENETVNRLDSELISAEGIYNSKTGMICMVGCFSSSFERQGNNLDSKDCSILINMQISPLNPEPGKRLSGMIRSTRGNGDPLFFKPVEIYSRVIYREQAVESVWRMDVEITMIIISLTLSCIFVGLQLRHTNKHPGVLSSISITMLVFLTLGHMIVLVLNFEAFLRNHKKQNVLLGSSGWLEVNEVVVRLMTMVAFLLYFRLLQVAWSARSVNESKNILWLAERKTIQFCLIIYIAGGFLAWLVHPRSEKTLHQVPHITAETHHSRWEDMQSYAGLVVDGFLFPQVILNALCDSKETSLTFPFYVGTTILRAFPHLYDAYRSRHYIPHLNSSYFYAKPNGDIYSFAWDIIIPCGGALFAVLIYIQQRFGGAFIVCRKIKRHGLYEMVPIASSVDVP